MQNIIFFSLYFPIIRISTNSILKDQKSREVVGDIHLKGNVSQNFIFDLSFHFMLKNG